MMCFVAFAESTLLYHGHAVPPDSNLFIYVLYILFCTCTLVSHYYTLCPTRLIPPTSIS